MTATQVFWIGNAGDFSQTLTLTVLAVATNGVLFVVMGTKTVSYTCISSDTTSSAATALQELLSASTFPEFSEVTWSVAGNVITAVANVAGTPFYSPTWGLTISATGGAAMTLTETVPNSSRSDIANVNNWLRNGVNQIPQAGDAVILADSNVPLLWNLDKLAVPATFTRWQSFTGTIGLPENNPLGYFEYRPTYLSFSAGSSSSSSSGAPSSPIVAIIGQGTIGQGPTRERYNFGSQQTSWVIRAAGNPEDDYSVRILSTNAGTTLQVTGVSVGVAMLPGETSSIASALVDGGATLDLGPSVTVGSSVQLYGAAADLFCAVPNLSMQQASTTVILTVGQNFPLITCITGSSITWNSDASIGTLTLQNNATLDASGDVRPFGITTLMMDADSCQVNDPNNRLTITNAVTMQQQITSGPFIFGSGRSFRIT